VIYGIVCIRWLIQIPVPSRRPTYARGLSPARSRKSVRLPHNPPLPRNYPIRSRSIFRFSLSIFFPFFPTTGIRWACLMMKPKWRAKVPSWKFQRVYEVNFKVSSEYAGMGEGCRFIKLLYKINVKFLNLPLRNSGGRGWKGRCIGGGRSATIRKHERSEIKASRPWRLNILFFSFPRV